MCGVCGADLRAIAESAGVTGMPQTFAVSHDTTAVKVTQKEASRIDDASNARLLKARKLIMLLDLDQTVIHTTVDPTVVAWRNDPSNRNHDAVTDVKSFILPDSPTQYHLKLRPGTREFLKELSDLFELHVYTMGTRKYAEQVVAIMDPKGSFFGGRILTRDESGSHLIKSPARLFPANQSMVVAVDDRPDVWEFSDHLIRVKPYEFFVGVGDINGPLDNAVLVVNDQKPKNQEEEKKAAAKEAELVAQAETAQQHLIDEQQRSRPLAQKEHTKDRAGPLLVDNDRQLTRILEILKEIHSRFYERVSDETTYPNVVDIMKEMKRSVFDGLNLVFSGVFPMDMDPNVHEFGKLARQFGAKISAQLTRDVTHVVAAKKGTSKCNTAKKIPNVRVVERDWLLTSMFSWKRENEQPYLLEPVCTDAAPADLDDLLVEANQSQEDPFDDEVDVSAKIGTDDWSDMDKEVEDELGSDDEDVSDGNGEGGTDADEVDEDEWDGFEEELEGAIEEVNEERAKEKEKAKMLGSGEKGKKRGRDGGEEDRNLPESKSARIESSQQSSSTPTQTPAATSSQKRKSREDEEEEEGKSESDDAGSASKRHRSDGIDGKDLPGGRDDEPPGSAGGQGGSTTSSSRASHSAASSGSGGGNANGASGSSRSPSHNGSAGGGQTHSSAPASTANGVGGFTGKAHESQQSSLQPIDAYRPTRPQVPGPVSALQVEGDVEEEEDEEKRERSKPSLLQQMRQESRAADDANRRRITGSPRTAVYGGGALYGDGKGGEVDGDDDEEEGRYGGSQFSDDSEGVGSEGFDRGDYLGGESMLAGVDGWGDD
ncbi:Carboxy-terminal domain (CTD) phosphatase [Rhizophlyctis rosea]|nr:Carboxy-terminal domain (CTD) phosphatase [Rhizophlyctis rosea]